MTSSVIGGPGNGVEGCAGSGRLPLKKPGPGHFQGSTSESASHQRQVSNAHNFGSGKLVGDLVEPVEVVDVVVGVGIGGLDEVDEHASD